MLLAPNATDAWLQMGSLSEFVGAWELAVQAFRTAVELGETRVGRRRLGRALLGAGVPEAAVVVLRLGVREAPEDGRMWSTLAEALLRADQVEEGLNAALEAVDVCYDDPVAHRILVRVYAKLGRMEEVVLALRDLVSVSPTDLAARVALGKTLISVREAEEARGLLLGLLYQPQPLETLPPILVFTLGEALVQIGERAQAEDCFSVAIAGSPDLADAATLALNLEDQGVSGQGEDCPTMPSAKWLADVFAFGDTHALTPPVSTHTPPGTEAVSSPGRSSAP